MEARTSLKWVQLMKPPDYAAITNLDVTSDGTDCNGMSSNSATGHCKEICAD